MRFLPWLKRMGFLAKILVKKMRYVINRSTWNAMGFLVRE